MFSERWSMSLILTDSSFFYVSVSKMLPEH